MDVPKPVSSTSTRFMDRVTVLIRSRGLAYRTEKTYCLWIKRFIKFHGYSSPDEMQPSHIEPFLSHLAIERFTAINTQRTALNALVFLFREFLKQEIGDLDFQQANKPRKLPTVLSQDEAKRVIAHLSGLRVKPASTNESPATPSVIRSRRSCYAKGLIYAIFRKFWGILRWRQLRFIPMWWACMKGE